MAGQRTGRNAVLLLSYAAVGCIAVAAIVLFVDGGDQERFLMQNGGAPPVQSMVGQARLQSLAYTFTPEENPLEDFDKGYTAKAYSYKGDPNPFENFEGYGFSTQSHAKGVSPYPATKPEDLKNVWETLPSVYPYDERKEGLKETFHTWNKWDWKEDPAKALKEVNVYDDGSKDSAWQLGDKMSFAWHHWEDNSLDQHPIPLFELSSPHLLAAMFETDRRVHLDQDSTVKALKEVNSWDNEKTHPTTGYKWDKTPKSVVDDPNDPQADTEKNILMSYKFPDY